jgi:hypothetical protein
MFVALARKTRFAIRSINNHQGNTSASSNGTSLLEPKQVTAALREQTPDAKPPERVPVRRRKRLARWVLAAALAGSARTQIQPARSKL